MNHLRGEEAETAASVRQGSVDPGGASNTPRVPSGAVGIVAVAEMVWRERKVCGRSAREGERFPAGSTPPTLAGLRAL